MTVQSTVQSTVQPMAQPMAQPTVQILGIRHHGPGSARSVVQALQALNPDIVLVEGPPDADSLLPLAHHADLKPPVALLLYRPDHPQEAVYYPFAVFSPEWQAIRYALDQAIPVRFMDLPQAYQWGQAEVESLPNSDVAEPDAAEPDAAEPDAAEPDVAEPDVASVPTAVFPADPLDGLAQAAGYTDSDRWWERLVEQRQDSTALFAAILEAIAALRQEDLAADGATTAQRPEQPWSQRREQQREAYMRQTIREAQRQGFERIAVVCGAWHAPALQLAVPTATPLAAGQPASRSTHQAIADQAKADQALLKHLTKTKTAATWIPWSYGRLALASGYGAGIESPGWYHHLWEAYSRKTGTRGRFAAYDAAQLVSSRWLTKVARLLRQQDIDASSASVIEAVRLAETLAALRGYSLPGLAELNEATQAVLCCGETLPMQLIQEKLAIADRLGRVPSETPTVPLQQDVERLQKRLRLKPNPEAKELVLDLRQPLDLERSQLLHRLTLLDIPWGKAQAVRAKGTFKDVWTLRWQPTFTIRLIEQGTWGNTVLAASGAIALHRIQQAQTLPALTELLDQLLLAELGDAIPVLMQRIQGEAAIAEDIAHLIQALPALAQVLRYGNVRRAETALLEPIVAGLVARICIGLPLVCASLDAEAAAQRVEQILTVHSAIALLQHPNWSDTWTTTLLQLSRQPGLAPAIAGKLCRLLLDTGHLPLSTVAQRLSLALSLAQDPSEAAAWVDGLLGGSGLLLLHHLSLWQILDTWVSQLSDSAFPAILPLLRRTFCQFPAAERRQMGQLVSQGFQGTSPPPGTDPSELNTLPHPPLNHPRAQAVLPILQQLLGPP